MRIDLKSKVDYFYTPYNPQLHNQVHMTYHNPFELIFNHLDEYDNDTAELEKLFKKKALLQWVKFSKQLIK